MTVSLSTTSSQPMPTGAARLLCMLALMPLLSSSQLPLVRTAELLLLALIADGSLAVATRVGHLLQRGAPPCIAPLSSSIQLLATGAQLLASVRLQHSTHQRLQLLGTARARLECSLLVCKPGAICTLQQGLQPRSSPLLLPGRPRARLLPSIPTPPPPGGSKAVLEVECSLLVAHLLLHSLHSLGRDPLGPCPMSRLHAVGSLRSRTPCWSWTGYPWTTWFSPTCRVRETLLRNSVPSRRCMTA